MKAKDKPTKKKVIYGKCDGCMTKVERRLLSTVRNDKLCLPCSNKEIEKWNKAVKESEMIDFRNPITLTKEAR